MRDLRQIVCTQHSYEMGIKCHVHSQPHFSRRQLGSRKQCLITCKGLDSNSNSLLTKVTTILPSASQALHLTNSVSLLFVLNVPSSASTYLLIFDLFQQN